DADDALPRVDVRAAIVGQRVAHRIFRIDPDVVAVAAACRSLRARERTAAVAAERLAPVLRAVKAAARDEDVVGILRIDGEADVVARTADERAIPAHRSPTDAGIVRAPQRALIRRLDERVDPPR